jgi:ketosteroid isomerase-like protein
MENPNIAIKDRWVEAVFAGDRDTLCRLADPALELHQPPGTPYEGVYRGPDGFLEFLDKFMAAYELESLDQTALYVEQSNPDRLAIGFHIKGTLKATGQAFASPQFECWDFRDGRIVAIRVFWFAPPCASGGSGQA